MDGWRVNGWDKAHPLEADATDEGSVFSASLLGSFLGHLAIPYKILMSSYFWDGRHCPVSIFLNFLS